MFLRSLIAHPRFLQRVLLTDAIATGLTAALLLAAADWLQSLLHLPADLLRGAGVVLVPFVTFVFVLSRRTSPSAGAVGAVVAINAAWVIASVWVVAGGSFQPNAFGTTFVLLQAAIVAIFADLGWTGLRRVRNRAKSYA